jgi:predicted transcriptional regulator
VDTFVVNALLRAITLRQRNVNSQFTRDSGISKSQIEILMFADTLICFNPYQVQKWFKQMNIQQVRLGIRSLASQRAIELITPGIKNKPATYMITKKGKQLLENYQSHWQINLVHTTTKI